MADGVELRKQIDSEHVRALLLVNGGGAVALLALLPAIIGKVEFLPLFKAALWGFVFFQVGLIAALLHNRYRRICSLEFDRHDGRPPTCKTFPFSLLPLKVDGSCVCRASVFFMWVSMAAFLCAGVAIIWGGFNVAAGFESLPCVEGAS